MCFQELIGVALDAGVVPFGDIFNLTRARDAMNIPILEWRDVKDLPSLKSDQHVKDEEREHLGCWSTRPGNIPNPLRVSSVVNHLKLDISYTRAPTEARVNPSDGNDDHLVFSKLVRYIYPKRPLPPPNGRYTLMEKSPMGEELLPDKHMTCFDFLYYATSSPETFEWKFSWAPAWTMVGKHMHFTDRMVELASGYLARAFGAFPDRLPPVSSNISSFQSLIQGFDFVLVYRRSYAPRRFCLSVLGYTRRLLNPFIKV